MTDKRFILRYYEIAVRYIITGDIADLISGIFQKNRTIDIDASRDIVRWGKTHLR